MQSIELEPFGIQDNVERGYIHKLKTPCVLCKNYPHAKTSFGLMATIWAILSGHGVLAICTNHLTWSLPPVASRNHMSLLLSTHPLAKSTLGKAVTAMDSVGGLPASVRWRSFEKPKSFKRRQPAPPALPQLGPSAPEMNPGMITLSTCCEMSISISSTSSFEGSRVSLLQHLPQSLPGA